MFGIIFFWSDNDAPAWASEMNPITRRPYTSLQEYEAVKQLTREHIQQAHIKATQSQPPPAPAPPPAPSTQAEREQEKKAQKCLPCLPVPIGGNPLSGLWPLLRYLCFDRAWTEVVRCTCPANIDALIQWGNAFLRARNRPFDATIPDDVRAAWHQAWRN